MRKFNNSNHLKCPDCGNWLKKEKLNTICECPSCNKKYRVKERWLVIIPYYCILFKITDSIFDFILDTFDLPMFVTFILLIMTVVILGIIFDMIAQQLNALRYYNLEEVKNH